MITPVVLMESSNAAAVAATPVSSLWSTLTTSATIMLALVFAIAGASKLRDQERTAADFAQLGLSRRLNIVVPLVELTVALSLIARPRLGGFAAFGMLVAFTAVLARAMKLSPDQPISCSCFGSLGPKPISSATLARNAGFMAAAVLAAAGTGLSRPDVAALVTISMLVVIASVISQMALVYRQLGRLWSVELAGEISS